MSPWPSSPTAPVFSTVIAGSGQERPPIADHTELTPTEAADRLALRELFDAYAHCADRRDAEGQKALFAEDTRFAVYMDGEDTEPTYVLQGREALIDQVNG